MKGEAKMESCKLFKMQFQRFALVAVLFPHNARSNLIAFQWRNRVRAKWPDKEAK
jgi:hypothetical protein